MLPAGIMGGARATTSVTADQVTAFTDEADSNTLPVAGSGVGASRQTHVWTKVVCHEDGVHDR